MENVPDNDPFAFEWARLYGDVKFGDSSVFLDVEDIYHETKKGKGYILCGKATIVGTTSGTVTDYAFVLQTDDGGFFPKAKIYPGIRIFKSIVPHYNGKGYIAVGENSGLPDVSSSAAYVSIKRNTLDVKCKLNLEAFNNSNKLERADVRTNEKGNE